MSESQQDNETLNAMYEILTEQRRRHAIECLLEHDTPLTLPDLADEIAVKENGTPISEVPAEEVKDVYLSLYHTHVPKLADANVIRYDQDNDTVAPLDRLSQFDVVVASVLGENTSTTTG